MIRVRPFAAILASAAAVLVLATAACSGGGSGKGTPSAGGGEPTIPSVVHSGDASVDHALDAALAPAPIELASLVRYEPVACAAEASADHPACAPDQKPGDMRQVFAKAGCARGWVTPEAVPGMFSGALRVKGAKLLGVYQPTPGVDDYGAQYIGIVATDKHDDGTDGAVALHIKDGRIVTLEDDCGAALKLVDQSRVANWVIKPGQAQAATPAATP